MMQGVEFHPDTVIVDMTEQGKYYNRGLHNMNTNEQPVGKISRPPFPYMFFEWARLRSHYGVYAHDIGEGFVMCVSFYYSFIEAKHDVEMMNRIPEMEMFLCSEEPFIYVNNHEGHCDIYQEAPYIPKESLFDVFEQQFGYTYKDFLSNAYKCTHIEYDEQFAYYIHTAIGGIDLFHRKPEIELVDYPRNYRRRMKHKHGKEPSPYFRIINPEQVRKVNTNDKPSQKTGIKMPLHTVRGHFRTVADHPLEWFNGTKWIPSHTRGDKKLGELKKHYRIRLPEKSQS
jgi:hypothetical protein